jgi:hypothetical protein
MAQGPGGQPANGFTVTFHLELDLAGGRGSRTRRMRLSGPPGLQLPELAATAITAS